MFYTIVTVFIKAHFPVHSVSGSYSPSQTYSHNYHLFTINSLLWLLLHQIPHQVTETLIFDCIQYLLCSKSLNCSVWTNQTHTNYSLYLMNNPANSLSQVLWNFPQKLTSQIKPTLAEPTVLLQDTLSNFFPSYDFFFYVFWPIFSFSLQNYLGL